MNKNISSEEIEKEDFKLIDLSYSSSQDRQHGTCLTTFWLSSSGTMKKESAAVIYHDTMHTVLEVVSLRKVQKLLFSLLKKFCPFSEDGQKM